jgi:hypothetical protein
MNRDPPAERWILPLAAAAVVMVAAAGCEEKIYEVSCNRTGTRSSDV